MKRIILLVLLLVLVGCLPTKLADRAATESARQNCEAESLPPIESVLIPIDADTVASYDSDEPTEAQNGARATNLRHIAGHGDCARHTFE